MATRQVDVTIAGKDQTGPASASAIRRMGLLEVEAHKMDAAMQAGAEKSKSSILGLGSALTFLKGLFAGIIAIAVGGFFRTAVREFEEGQQSANEMGGALANLGVSYDKLQPSIDATIAKFQQLSGQDADDVSRAYSNLITKTGSYAKATDNLGLVFDIAAKNHLPLIEASDLMAKVLDGNFKPLKALGVQATTTGEAIEKLGAKYRGFAERESGTLKVALGNVAEGYRNVAQQVGEVILGNENAGSATNRFAGFLGDMAHWLEANRQPLTEFVNGLIMFSDAVVTLTTAVTNPLFYAFYAIFVEGSRSAQAAIVAFVAILEVVPSQARFMAGGILKAFGELADGLEPILAKLGIKLDGFGEKLANTGSNMQRLALHHAGAIGRASRDTINTILDGGTIDDPTKAKSGKSTAKGSGTDTGASDVAATIKRAEDLTKAFTSGVAMTDLELRQVLLGKTLDDLERLSHDLSLKLEDRTKAHDALKAARDANPFLAKTAKAQFGTPLAGPAAPDPLAPMANVTGAQMPPIIPPSIANPAITFTDDLSAGFRKATADIFGTVDAVHTLAGDVSGIGTEAIANFGAAWGDATEQIVQGSLSVGQAIADSARKAVGAAASAKGSETLLDAGKALALGFGGDFKQFAVAAKLFAVGTGYKALAGVLGGGGGSSAGGGGGGGGLSSSGFQQSAAATQSLGKVTIVFPNKKSVIDANNPDDQDAIREMIQKLAGNRQIEFVVG